MNPFSSNVYENEEIEQLYLVAEQLDACYQLLKTNNAIKARLALIWIDNLADTLMYRQSRKSLEGETNIPDPLWGDLERKVFITKDKRKEIQRYYEQKVSFLHKHSKGISSDTALILKTGHQYRNLAYHLDKHNPATIITIAKVFFAATCSLLLNYPSSFTIGYSRGISWLTKYGIHGTSVNFADAEREISTYYRRRVKVTLATTRKVFEKDIDDRCKAIQELQKEDLPPLFSSKEGVDSFLKLHEFHQYYEQNSEESEEFDRARFEALRKPTKNHVFKMSEAKKAYEIGYIRGMKSYKASLSYKTFTRIQECARTWNKITGMGKLLNSYKENDQLLGKVENSFYAAAELWDREVQQYIDLKRGK